MLKILSDFDGVWTDQAAEALAIRARFDAELAQLVGRAIDAELAQLVARIRAEPSRYGWAPEGRISAYVDEDPLLETAALALAIDRGVGIGAADRNGSGDGAVTRAWRDALARAGHASAVAFSNACFLAAMAEFRARHEAAVVDGSLETLRELRTLGVELVVVSNSPPEKIAQWFERAGVAVDGPDALLRVRGHAQKWRTASDLSETLGDRTLYVDRPFYRAVLEEERADLVIGDVYSLDLALPALLRRERARGAPRELVLRRHAHTPRWVVDGCAGGAIDHFVRGIDELPRLARALGAAGARA